MWGAESGRWGKWRGAMEVEQRAKPWTRVLAVGIGQRAGSVTQLEVVLAM